MGLELADIIGEVLLGVVIVISWVGHSMNKKREDAELNVWRGRVSEKLDL